VLVGTFEYGTGRPYIGGRLVFPRLARMNGDILWLVDTGADTSQLGSLDGQQMGLDFAAAGR